MRLLLISGFLGSGKTTFIIKLTKKLIHAEKKVAILVNEIGKIGIDNQVFNQLDLNVWELMGGCICCTLSGDLVNTLQKIETEYDIDTVIIEPSGSADPSNILRALPYYQGKALENIQTIALIDPLRIRELYQVLTPLITLQISKAQTVLITKTDLATPEEIQYAEEIARDLNPGCPIFHLSENKSIPESILKEVQ